MSRVLESFHAGQDSRPDNWPPTADVDLVQMAADYRRLNLSAASRLIGQWGNCRDTDPEQFYPLQGGSLRAVKRVCGQCGVRRTCLLLAMRRQETYGIWGGLNFRDRQQLRRRFISLSAGAVKPS